MATPQVLVLRAPGTNCDQETAFAFEQAGGRAARVHVNRLLEQPDLLEQYQILCLPGGFSYGDDIAAGRILGNLVQHHLFEALRQFQDRGHLILGICNGFQILMKSGLLLPNDDAGPPATLAWNESGKYEDRWVHLRVEPSPCVFLRGMERMYLPVAHAEGRFVARDQATLEQLARGGQLPLRYTAKRCSSESSVVAYPANPNGSQHHVAGLCDSTGRVLGLMPHPERHIDRTQHPHWTRDRAANGNVGDGLRVFQNAVEYFR